MSRNIANLSFAVHDEVVGHSDVWRFWATRHGDVYLVNAGLGGTLKLSFHRSGICRYAFTQEHGHMAGMSDRVMGRWQRPDIPPSGSNSFGRLAWLAFPTDYLSRGPSVGVATTHILPAPTGMAAFVEVGLCRQPEHVMQAGLQLEVTAGISKFAALVDDINVFVRWYHGAWENHDLRMPASHGKPAYRFLANEATDNLRPVRLTVKSRPSDREAIHITELGGCLDGS